jgi:transposase
MYLCVLDRAGQVQLRRNLPTRADAFLQAVAPYRPDLLVACECVHTWYWLADLCAAEALPFALGHALYMRAVHTSKSKSDRIDAETIARLAAGGLLPMAYAYPRQRRGLRDLLRARLRFVRQRAELYAHVHTALRQANLEPVGSAVKYASKRSGLPGQFADEHVGRSVAADLELTAALDAIIRRLERQIAEAARGHYAKELAVLQSIPGVGPVTALTVLLEIDAVGRFATRQQFASYARLVCPPRESAGKAYAPSGRKQGNAYLKWAFSEAAVHAAQYDDRIGAHLKKLESRFGPGKARSVLAHKLGRAAYHMLRRGRVFDLQKFLRG